MHALVVVDTTFYETLKEVTKMAKSMELEI